MQPEQLDQFFADNATFDRPEWRALVRPCVDIVHSQPAASDGSRFGGSPYLPADFILPDTPTGCVYRFVGQLDLADFAHLSPYDMPSTGLLSLFYLDYADDWQDDDHEPFWGDDGYVRAFYFADTTDFVLRSDIDTGVQAVGLTFTKGVDLPCNAYFDVAYPDDVDAFDDAYYAVFGRRMDRLFGYPQNSSLGYDPTPTDGQWLPFLNIFSHKALQWCWHDGDWLMTFIERRALAQGDFGQIKSDAG